MKGYEVAMIFNLTGFVFQWAQRFTTKFTVEGLS